MNRVPVDERIVASTEDWFLKRGLPHFIADYSASRDIWTRALPALTVVFLLELLLASKRGWPWWLDLVALGAAFGIAALAWGVGNRVRGRPLFARPDDLGAFEIALFVVVPALMPVLFGRQFAQAVTIAVSNLALLGLIYVTTSYGLVPMTRWGLGQLVRQLESVFTLFVRALPLLILVLALLLFTTEVWQTAAELDAFKMTLAVGFFVLIGTAFAAVRVPRQISELATFESWARTTERCANTPLAPVVGDLLEPASDGIDAIPPLTRRQWSNVGLVVLVSEAVQVLLVTVLVFVFFVVFGVITLTRGVMYTWVGRRLEVIHEWKISGDTFVLTEELLKVAIFLAAFSGLYFTVVLLTDATYREEFLERVVSDVRDAFAARAAYLAYLQQGR
ncbi:MAG: hypothetical protein JWL83_1992 [Actinomycetia bacterium]|nr:hypothetical protein [Actinomycetes bacterium]